MYILGFDDSPRGRGRDVVGEGGMWWGGVEEGQGTAATQAERLRSTLRPYSFSFTVAEAGERYSVGNETIVP